MSDNYCIDCFHFKTQTLYRHTIEKSLFNVGKVKKAVDKKGRVVVFWCKITGAYYVNNYRVYYIKACDDNYDPA